MTRWGSWVLEVVTGVGTDEEVHAVRKTYRSAEGAQRGGQCWIRKHLKLPFYGWTGVGPDEYRWENRARKVRVRVYT